jgi:hypothetical protein
MELRCVHGDARVHRMDVHVEAESGVGDGERAKGDKRHTHQFCSTLPVLSLFRREITQFGRCCLEFPEPLRVLRVCKTGTDGGECVSKLWRERQCL